MSTEQIQQTIKEIKNPEQYPDAFGATISPRTLEKVSPVGDIVTLASINVKASELTLEVIREYVSKFVGNIDDIYIGLFRLESQPGMISIDINIVVSSAFRGNTLRFAKSNGQESIFASHGNGEGYVVQAGGDGVSVIKEAHVMGAAAEQLRCGRYVVATPSGWLDLKNPNGHSGSSNRCA